MRSWILSLDVVAVVLFVAIGRDTHQQEATIAGLLGTAAPFLIALALGWLAARAWQAPAALTTGVITLAVTVLGGMVLRRFAFGDGTATTFVIVTTAFLTGTMLGWRLVAALVANRLSHRPGDAKTVDSRR
jgi:multisubunit Na+/H+ antiporter MnhB subunit